MRDTKEGQSAEPVANGMGANFGTSSVPEVKQQEAAVSESQGLSVKTDEKTTADDQAAGFAPKIKTTPDDSTAKATIDFNNIDKPEEKKEPENKKKKPRLFVWVKSHKIQTAVTAVIAIAIICLAIFGIAKLMHQNAPESQEDGTTGSHVGEGYIDRSDEDGADTEGTAINQRYYVAYIKFNKAAYVGVYDDNNEVDQTKLQDNMQAEIDKSSSDEEKVFYRLARICIYSNEGMTDLADAAFNEEVANFKNYTDDEKVIFASAAMTYFADFSDQSIARQYDEIYESYTIDGERYEAKNGVKYDVDLSGKPAITEEAHHE